MPATTGNSRDRTTPADGGNTTGPPRRPPVRAIAIAVVLIALLGSGLVFALGPSSATTERRAGDGLAENAQSTQVARILDAAPEGASAPAVVVYSRGDGGALTAADREAVTTRAAALSPLALPGAPVRPVFDERGTLATVSVVVPLDGPGDENTDRVAEIREVASADLPSPLRAQVTGAPAFAADLARVFEGADVTLLAVTALVVAVLLLVTYRSPVLWLVPLAVVAVADRLATVLVGMLAPHVGVTIDGSASGILSVLVFGAGTNYALLLVSRYRDELRRHEDRGVAMSRALRGTAPAVLASGGTVVLALSTLLAARLTSYQGLGFAGIVGIVVAMVFGLVVLPAALVLPGRKLFWPLVPRIGDTPTAEREGLWRRLGAHVARRPAAVAAGAVVVLAVLALAAPGMRTGLSQSERFRTTPEAVEGQRTLAELLPAGSAQPLTVLSSPETADTVAAVAGGTPGVEGATTVPRTAGGYAVTSVVVSAAPGTGASDATIDRLRERLADVPGARALVGGQTAEDLDTRRATGHDTRLVVPLVLAVVLTVLALLLRALVAPILLVLTVVASYFAALGAGRIVFGTVYDFPALDSPVPLLSFLFLVALGVDYNIFLIARTREDCLTGYGTRAAVLRALAATGGVITSAGVLLAAVFAVLGVLPLITLTQMGVIVCVGVLLDTLLVRTVLVPALVVLTGRRFWWPGNAERSAGDRPADGGSPGPLPATTVS